MYLRSGKIINSNEKENIYLCITEKTLKKHYNNIQLKNSPTKRLLSKSRRFTS